MRLILVAAAILAGMFGAVEHANAAEARGSISNYEFIHMQRGSMHDMETAMGVVGAGVIVHTDHHGHHVIKQYPWCGRPLSEGVVQISFDENTSGQLMGSAASLFDMRGTSLFDHQPAPEDRETCQS